MSKRAVILAGGKGTRLKPYTVVLPKPLMPIGDFPILEVIIKQLVHHGFDHVTLTVNHQADLIKTFFGDGSKWGILIDYSLEEKPLKTMGPLKKIDDLPENFLVMNGDILTDLNYSKFFENHCNQQRLFSISSARRSQTNLYGVLVQDENNRLKDFKEKPVSEFLVSMGIYALSQDVLNYIPDDTPYGFDELMLQFIDKDMNVKVDEFDGYWLDIGRPDDYMQAIEEFEKKKHIFLPE